MDGKRTVKRYSQRATSPREYNYKNLGRIRDKRMFTVSKRGYKTNRLTNFIGNDIIVDELKVQRGGYYGT